MSKRRKLLVVAIVAVVVVAGGAYGAFAVLAGGSAPPPVSLSGSTGAASGSITATDLAGSWTVAASRSFVGYRVREKLAFLPAPSDAVGRTSAVQGRMTIQGTTVKTVDVAADLRQLTSDRSMRDDRMHTIGLQSDTFPTARFVLTSPIALDSVPSEGKVVSAAATGDLTLHGVTKAVTIQIQAKWTSSGIQVVGSLPVAFADFGISTPSIGGFVTSEDHGTLELQLSFVKA
jgi:polyisoprenoid-binding protein YceI